MKYAITLSSFRNVEPLPETMQKLAEIGFDAVEMIGEPADVHDVNELKELLQNHGLSVCGITGMWGAISSDSWKRRLLSTNPDLVDSAKHYVQDCVRLCNSLGGEELNVCLFTDDDASIDRTHGTSSEFDKERLAAKAAPILSDLCRFARDYGVTLVLEPLNRYSTPFCSSAKDAMRIINRMNNSDAVGILLDTFHMNIEEDTFENAIQTAGSYLKHMHFADNNRKMPGSAHIDFTAILESVKKIGYNGFISFEPSIPRKTYEDDVKSGLKYIQTMMATSSC